ncbi:MAG: DUF4056 domain-containing protein [Planctomycetaceae bacterium]|nr:DUF4056 domain-containing protein [Planctomycetaceae bacterium]
MNRWVTTLALIAGLLSGCGSQGQPRLRISSYFGSVSGMECADPASLGRHNYATPWSEKNGLIYTCRGGFIDLGHVREAADRTVYAANLIYNNVMKGKVAFSFHIIEKSEYQLMLTYPEDWYVRTESQRQQAARELSLNLGQYVAHNSLIWHEIITWYGYASTGLFSEQISSFSWEDTYSDELGTLLAVEAMRQSRPYDQAMTDVLYKKLRELDAQPPEVTSMACKQVYGHWFEGGFYFFVKMYKRNFDVGFRDGQVTPWLVPGVCSNTVVPAPCVVPSLTDQALQGFKAALTLKPKILEQSHIYNALAADHGTAIRPDKDFPLLLNHIMEQAREKYGSGVDKPSLPHSIASQDRPSGGQSDSL